jgi:hypothetical protein
MALFSHHQLKEMGHDPGLSADASCGDSRMNAPANVASNPSAVKAAEVRVTQYNWKELAEELSGHGCVVLEKLLSADECRQIAGLYPHEGYFRSHIYMARHGFGKGEYRYFKYPLPDLVGGLRAALYPRLADIANDWNARMGLQFLNRYKVIAASKHSSSPERRASRPKSSDVRHVNVPEFSDGCAYCPPQVLREVVRGRLCERASSAVASATCTVDSMSGRT